MRSVPSTRGYNRIRLAWEAKMAILACMRRAARGFVLSLLVLATVSVAHGGGPPAPIPEIDPSLAAGALTLVVGGILVLMGRGERK